MTEDISKLVARSISDKNRRRVEQMNIEANASTQAAIWEKELWLPLASEEGIAIKKASLIPRDTRRVLAGLVVSHAAARVTPINHNRAGHFGFGYIANARRLLDRQVIRGWGVVVNAYTKDDDNGWGYTVDVNETIVVSGDYKIYSVAKGNHPSAINHDQTKKSVVDLLVANSVQWTEPPKDTYM